MRERGGDLCSARRERVRPDAGSVRDDQPISDGRFLQ